MPFHQDKIRSNEVSNLSELFYERIRRSESEVAYTCFNAASHEWQHYSWSDIEKEIERWHNAFRHEGLVKGDRVAIKMKNCPEWVIFDQAAFSLGLVVVPLYTNDRDDNVFYILNDANVKLLFIESDKDYDLTNLNKIPADLKRIIAINNESDHVLVQTPQQWLPSYAETINYEIVEADDLATIVYTSGTTGKPKGVMLSHNNILSNALSASRCEPFYAEDLFLSFLPLSHMFERTVGYYLPVVCGATVAYARSIDDLAEDLLNIKPTILVTVPRIFERVYNKINSQLMEKSSVAQYLFHKSVEIGWERFLCQQRRKPYSIKLVFWPILNKLVASKILAKLGGRVRLAISGGAPLSPSVAKTFVGLGLTISQGYGLTEASPVICTNRLSDNKPFSVGQAFDNVEVKLGENDELLVKAPSVMLGYWQDEAATAKTIEKDGWLHTGDKARFEGEHIYITGRLKEILVLSNGEKVPPADIELAILNNPLFEQVLVIGEAKPFLTAIVVFNEEHWHGLANELQIDKTTDNKNTDKVHQSVLNKIAEQLSEFPGYAKILRVHISNDSWTVENGLITPTLKLKRNKLVQHYEAAIIDLYKGH